MKRRWNTISAIRAVNAEYVTDEENLLIVRLPLKGLGACSALDYLKNHTAFKLIIRHSI